jgi:hypothetical protein
MTTRTLPPRPTSPPTLGGLKLRQSAGPAPGRRVVLYGPGGIGKTSLMLSAPGPLAVFDLDNSLAMLGVTDTAIVEAQDWSAMLAALGGPGWDDIRTIAVDTGTCAQELCEKWVYANVKGDKGATCQRIEDYGFGKGFRHVYDVFGNLLTALENHTRQGRNVILVCHEALFKVTNPEGEDFYRHEPKLQDAGDGGKASIKLRVRDWADTVACLLEDVAVDSKSGKARGCGSRTLYLGTSPYYMAKHRQHIGKEPLVALPVTTENGGEVWGALLGA